MKIKFFKTISALFMVLVIITGSASSATINGSYISSLGACVMDFETGEVLYQHDGNSMRVPASLTKLMTLYCTYEAIARGDIAMDTVVPISNNVYNYSRIGAYQSVPIYYDTTYTVDEMISIIVTYSPCAPAVALAELIDGSEGAFVDRMNNTAKELGIDAYYYDSSGVSNNKISPIGLATLVRSFISKYPDIITRSSQRSIEFKGRRYYSTNKLYSSYYYPGADGLKTGTSTAAGCCFCGTAMRNGRRVIAVSMHSSSGSQRFADVTKMLDYGFAVIEEKYNSIYFTNMRTFINGNEVPTLLYKGGEPHAVVVAEDLVNYGFDVNWNNDTRTLYIKHNQDKPYTPMNMEPYRNKDAKKAFSVTNNSDVKVILNDGIQDYILEDVYAVNGYMCISVDEFQKMYDFDWNSTLSISDITVE